MMVHRVEHLQHVAAELLPRQRLVAVVVRALELAHVVEELVAFLGLNHADAGQQAEGEQLGVGRDIHGDPGERPGDDRAVVRMAMTAGGHQ
jgi:hypothetical protein